MMNKDDEVGKMQKSPLTEYVLKKYIESPLVSLSSDIADNVNIEFGKGTFTFKKTEKFRVICAVCEDLHVLICKAEMIGITPIAQSETRSIAQYPYKWYMYQI